MPDATINVPLVIPEDLLRDRVATIAGRLVADMSDQIREELRPLAAQTLSRLIHEEATEILESAMRDRLAVYAKRIAGNVRNEKLDQLLASQPELFAKT
jgi:hypothetical protein